MIILARIGINRQARLVLMSPHEQAHEGNIHKGPRFVVCPSEVTYELLPIRSQLTLKETRRFLN
jgi:hypothetical protein